MSVRSKMVSKGSLPGKVLSPKPTNVFYVWYAELCRRANLSPLACVKPARPKNETVLDFTCDRIKVEEWMPILAALRQDTSLHVVAVRSRVECKFLPEVDSERKVKEMKRKGGYLYTHYILEALLEALCYLVSRSQVLMYLELDGLPVTNEYLGPLLEALSKNKSLKVLSFKYCPLRDNGCQRLCTCLRDIPNVEVLNLTACGLGSLSAQHVAKVIRYQQINRYCESWHCSLRYEDPDVELMTGLKRITLNCNPNVGDEGLTYILNELDDDLWIKALDMQRCNITENVAKRLIDVINYSKSLEIVDFRHNELLSEATMRKILDILKTKQHFGYDNEYEWCMTATSLPYEHSVQEVTSSTSTNTASGKFQKSKSASFKDAHKKTSLASLPIRRIKTCSAMSKQQKLGNIKEDVTELAAQLEREKAKRLQTERENKKLQKKLDNLQCKPEKPAETKNVKFNVGSVGKAKLPRTRESLNIKIPLGDDDAAVAKPLTPKKPKETAAGGETDEPKQKKGKDVEFVFAMEGGQRRSVAQSLFENLMYRNCEESDSEAEGDEVIDYYESDGEAGARDADVDVADASDSGSNASLLKFMESIKNNVKFDSLDCGRQTNSANWENNDSNKMSIVH